MSKNELKCYIIAGPNGAGKTTFAENFLPEEADCLNFLNADLIAKGIAPFKPESVAIEAGKLFLKRMNTIVSNRESFAFETTLSGLNYIDRIKNWKKIGYEIILYFLKLENEEMAIHRVQLRVAEGGHNVPEDVIIRRYHRGWKNFQKYYKHRVDAWVVFDNSKEIPEVLEEKNG
ncbi:zeta toxin family protein [uncultured Desulfobacter sp.]|uniref:zeta toxin family protein n=1 Tax=uncultured Desulfobacter sp. TaxID=240139 RepID=UPI002AA65FEA|nr:zeta toxin family protein [uncultured Desulfobacter sp.]